MYLRAKPIIQHARTRRCAAIISMIVTEQVESTLCIEWRVSELQRVFVQLQVGGCDSVYTFLLV